MKRRLDDALNRAVDQLPHPDIREIIEAPVQKMTEHDEITRQTCPKRYGYGVRNFAAACACIAALVLGGGAYYDRNYRVDSVIGLDVNPSFEICTNQKDMVLSIAGLNPEARELLEGRVYKGWAVTEVVETLFIGLEENQYINVEQNAVLLTVSNSDEAHAQRLEAKLQESIRRSLQETAVTPQIVGQYIPSGDSDTVRASQLGISAGKLRYIEGLLQENPSYTVEELADYSVEELLRLQAGEDWDDGHDDDWEDGDWNDEERDGEKPGDEEQDGEKWDEEEPDDDRDDEEALDDVRGWEQKGGPIEIRRDEDEVPERDEENEDDDSDDDRRDSTPDEDLPPPSEGGRDDRENREDMDPEAGDDDADAGDVSSDDADDSDDDDDTGAASSDDGEEDD